MDLSSFRPSRPASTSYWPRIWAVLLLAPAALALVTMSPMWAAVAFNLTFGLPLALWLSLHVHEAREFPSKLPRGLRAAALVSVTGLGLIGLFMFSAPLALLTLVAYVATVGPARWPARPSTKRPEATAPSDITPPATDGHAEPIDVVLTHDTVRAMTDAELCLAWRRSFAVLQQVQGTQLRALVVETRQLLLDEVEARHPEGLQAWLGSGARAAGGPDRFIGLDGDSGQPEAA